MTDRVDYNVGIGRHKNVPTNTIDLYNKEIVVQLEGVGVEW